MPLSEPQNHRMRVTFLYTVLMRPLVLLRLICCYRFIRKLLFFRKRMLVICQFKSVVINSSVLSYTNIFCFKKCFYLNLTSLAYHEVVEFILFYLFCLQIYDDNQIVFYIEYECLGVDHHTQSVYVVLKVISQELFSCFIDVNERIFAC